MKTIRLCRVFLLLLVFCAVAHRRVETVRFQSKLVMPEGNDSWYIDKYESYILNELIPDVQQRYRTIEARYGGDHSWAYWDRQVREVLKLAAQKMRLPAKTRSSHA